jgi:hypothetical protein
LSAAFSIVNTRLALARRARFSVRPLVRAALETAARQVGDAACRQLPLHHQGRRAHRPRSGASNLEESRAAPSTTMSRGSPRAVETKCTNPPVITSMETLPLAGRVAWQFCSRLSSRIGPS